MAYNDEISSRLQPVFQSQSKSYSSINSGKASRVAVALLAMLVSSKVHAGTWTQVSYIYNEANHVVHAMSVTNTGASAITVQGGTYSQTRTQWVVGAAQPTPPAAWAAKFDPLYQGTVTHSVSWDTATVLPAYTYGADLLWVYEVGTQTFEYSDNQVRINRERDWWKPNGSAVLLVPPPPPSGGEG